MSAGERLLALRRRAGMTQIALSEASGVTQGYISHLERNKSRMSVDVAKSLAKVFGVAWSLFFDDDSCNVDKAS